MIAKNPTIALTVPIVLKLRRPAAQRSGLGWQHSLKIFHYRRDRNIAYFASRAQNDLHSTFGNLLSDRDSKGDSHQIRVLELNPRPLIAVVEDYVEAGCFQAGSNVDRGLQQDLILHIDGSHHNLERRDRRRQPESVLVVTLLYGCGQDALNPDPIAAHDRHRFLAVLVQYAQPHRIRIAVTQFEDVPNLNRRIDAQRLAAIRASLASRHRAQIGVSRG